MDPLKLLRHPATGSPAGGHQINNMTIKPVIDRGKLSWAVCAPDGRQLETFRRQQDADEWARDTWDFLAPDTVRGRINAAWRDLKMPKLEQMAIFKEHARWWVMGWNKENECCAYSVEHAAGKGSSRGMCFEQVS